MGLLSLRESSSVLGTVGLRPLKTGLDPWGALRFHLWDSMLPMSLKNGLRLKFPRQKSYVPDELRHLPGGRRGQCSDLFQGATMFPRCVSVLHNWGRRASYPCVCVWGGGVSDPPQGEHSDTSPRRKKSPKDFTWPETSVGGIRPSL